MWTKIEELYRSNLGMRLDAPEVQGLSTCEDRRQVQTELGEGPSMNVVFKMGGQPRELPGLLTTLKVKIAAKAEKAKTMGISDVKYLSPAINSCSAGFEQQVIVGEPETSLDNLSLDDDCFDCSGPTRGEQPRPRVDFGNP